MSNMSDLEMASRQVGRLCRHSACGASHAGNAGSQRQDGIDGSHWTWVRCGWCHQIAGSDQQAVAHQTGAPA
jgi:hypothetical protein